MVDLNELGRPAYGAGPREALTRFWVKAATFEGRASRAEYWWWQLINGIVAVVLALVGDWLTHAQAEQQPMVTRLTSLAYGSYGAGVPRDLWALIVLVPNAAVTVRRFHDLGRSGRWALGLLLPGWVVAAVNPIILAVAALSDAPLGSYVEDHPRLLIFVAVLRLVAVATTLVVMLWCLRPPTRTTDRLVTGTT